MEKQTERLFKIVYAVFMLAVLFLIGTTPSDVLLHMIVVAFIMIVIPLLFLKLYYTEVQLNEVRGKLEQLDKFRR